MKFIRRFENMENKEIDRICRKFGIKDYYIYNGLVNVNGDVDLPYKNLKKLPLKFGEVTSNFWCYNNQLTSLEGAPKKVGGGFLCDNNNLTTLDGSPEEIGDYFSCFNNNLTTLMFAPERIGGNFISGSNPLPPEILSLTKEQLNWVVKLQADYNMWRGGKLYLPRFEMLIEEIGDYIK